MSQWRLEYTHISKHRTTNWNSNLRPLLHYYSAVQTTSMDLIQGPYLLMVVHRGARTTSSLSYSSTTLFPLKVKLFGKYHSKYFLEISSNNFFLCVWKKRLNQLHDMFECLNMKISAEPIKPFFVLRVPISQLCVESTNYVLYVERIYSPVTLYPASIQNPSIFLLRPSFLVPTVSTCFEVQSVKMSLRSRQLIPIKAIH